MIPATRVGRVTGFVPRDGKPYREKTFARCPQKFRKYPSRPTVFCADCRFYFGANAEEYEIWAA